MLYSLVLLLFGAVTEVNRVDLVISKPEQTFIVSQNGVQFVIVVKNSGSITPAPPAPVIIPQPEPNTPEPQPENPTSLIDKVHKWKLELTPEAQGKAKALADAYAATAQWAQAQIDAKKPVFPKQIYNDIRARIARIGLTGWTSWDDALAAELDKMTKAGQFISAAQMIKTFQDVSEGLKR